MTSRIYSDEYTGPRFTYALRNRPMQIGAQPQDYIIGSGGAPRGRARHGTIQYPRELTPDELYSYELEPIVALPLPPMELTNSTVDYSR